MKLLITGASGFLGNRLVCMLSERHEIFAIVRTRPLEGESRVTWIEQDLSEPLKESGLPSNVDAIIHLAQSRRYRSLPEESKDVFRVNVGSTLELLEYGRKRGIYKFLYASTGGIYGYGPNSFMETDPVDPANLYLTSKYCSELLMKSYDSLFGIVTFRFFFIYGVGQKGMLIPRLIQSIRKGEPIHLSGSHGLRINPVHIDDALQVIPSSLGTSVTGTFNVAGDEVISIKELSEMIGKRIGKVPKFIYEDPGVQGDLLGDNSRMKTLIGVVPKIRLEQGIAEVVDWAQGNQT